MSRWAWPTCHIHVLEPSRMVFRVSAEMQWGHGSPLWKSIFEVKNLHLWGKKPRHKAGMDLLGIAATLMDHEAR